MNGEYSLNGIISAMHQHDKPTKNVKYAHTSFTIVVEKLPQKDFDRIVGGVCEGHFINLAIKLKPQQSKVEVEN